MRLFALFVANAIVLSFFACRASESADEDGAASDSGDSAIDGSIAAPTELERGEGMVDALGCAGCHQAADPSTVLAGADAPVSGTEAFGGNLTSDPLTGIGRWTNVQIGDAIATGVGPDGRTLCPAMPRYSQVADADLAALVAYLQSLSPVIHTVPASVCGANMGGFAASLASDAAAGAASGWSGDAGIDPTTRGTPLPAPGELVISEVMDDPTGPEPNDEWFELHNVAAFPVALRGLTVVDADSRFFTVTDAADLAPGEYAVFARTAEGARMSAVPTPAYVYGEAETSSQGVVLLNDSSGALAVIVGSVQIDRFDYGRVEHRVTGASVERVADNDAGVIGCVAVTPWAPDAGKGTPDAPSDCTFLRTANPSDAGSE